MPPKTLSICTEAVKTLGAQTRSNLGPAKGNRALSKVQRSTLSSAAYQRTLWKAPSSKTARRHASTTASASSRARNLIIGTSFVAFTVLGYIYVTDTRASVHKYLTPRLVRLLCPDAEDAHHFGIDTLAWLHAFNLHPRERASLDDDATLRTSVLGYSLRNPLAFSGGLDKDGTAIDPLFALGVSIVEIGGVTPLAQPGNERPRVWRVPSQNAMINRYGLNSAGAPAVALTLRKRVAAFADKLGYTGLNSEDLVLNGEAGVPPGSLQPGKLLAVQIAKNKTTPENDTAAVAADYVSCVQTLGRYADILVVNVSSPNTPGLRSLQAAAPLTHILTEVVKAAHAVPRTSKPAVLVKVSPDEASDADISGICDAVWAAGVQGVIVANTTKTRPISEPGLLTASEARVLDEMGGYSGPALLELTVELVGRYRRALDEPLNEAGEKGEQTVIFASGGICKGADVQRVLDAGASVGMAYTALTYGGPGWVTETKSELSKAIQGKGQ